MDNPEDLACATTAESQPFLKVYGSQTAEIEQADLEHGPSRSACNSTSNTRALGHQTSFFHSLGPNINAIVLLFNLAMATFVIATWVQEHPGVCSCNDGPWCRLSNLIS